MDLTQFLIHSIVFAFAYFLGDLTGSRRQMKYFISQQAQEENNRLWKDQIQDIMGGNPNG